MHGAPRSEVDTAAEDAGAEEDADEEEVRVDRQGRRGGGAHAPFGSAEAEAEPGDEDGDDEEEQEYARHVPEAFQYGFDDEDDEDGDEEEVARNPLLAKIENRWSMIAVGGEERRASATTTAPDTDGKGTDGAPATAGASAGVVGAAVTV